MLTLSPKIGEFLIRAAETPDIELALRKILFEYLDLKLKELESHDCLLNRKVDVI